MTRTVVMEKEFTYPPEKLWRALTEGALVKEWLLDNDFQPVVGHRFHFRSTPMGDWDGVIESEVIAVEPNRKLSYTWSSLGLDSTVTFTLTPTPAGTHLRMEQAGFRPEHDAAFKGATYGWRNFMERLQQTVEKLS